MTAEKPTPEQLAQRLVSPHPIVQEATLALSRLFKVTFDTLSHDIERAVKTNTASDEVTKAANGLTVDMINLLRDRVEGIFTAAGDAAARSPWPRPSAPTDGDPAPAAAPRAPDASS
jgi:hypothetical protein